MSDRTFIFNVTAPAQSALQAAASNLLAGQSSQLLSDTGLTSNGYNTPLPALQWLNRFFYDSTRKKAFMLGKNADTQGRYYYAMLYNEATNSWAWGQSNTPTGELGHVYESFAFDRSTGELYTGKWYGTTIKRLAMETSLTAWTDPATSAYAALADVGVQPAMCWHPNLYGAGDGGLVIAYGNGYTATVVVWRKATNTFATVAGTSHSASSAAYMAACEYVRGGDYAVVSYAPARSGRTFKVPAGSGGSLGAASQMADPPVNCTYPNGSATLGALLDDPAGGQYPYILEKSGTNKVWKYNGSLWLEIGTHPFVANNRNNECAIAACYPYGVFWAKNALTTVSTIWKPNA